MKPIYFSIGKNFPIMVIPDSQAHLDGHTVLTYTYSIFKNATGSENEFLQKENTLHTEKKHDPDYMGFITFEQPGKLFTYTADGGEDLASDEVEEIIEVISHYRDTPKLWSI
ncbi:hypothetical protein HDF24_03410 [Mucilaginibacter sp. X4EP1]|uniref:hypothetical protein n=1 Tax=Mucilaginibacter sp. X4EP1 TaxID=2723092 RepID=UPI00216765D9|nr:hypothetical protein [Mucilaginibacter sp. X4EP1]MCS3812075.1 hypothetical protein [Mucilaginibacter sp. X4EP1]